MAFKMNTSIGKIQAKTQGTKPHAKSVAMAQAPKPATGNVGMPSSPFHIEGNSNSPSEQPLSRNRNLRRKQIEARNKAAAEKGKKLNEKKSGGQGSGGGTKIKANTTTKTPPSGSGKKSYREAYKNADKSKYKDFASFEKAAKAYNAKKKDTSTTPREKVRKVSEVKAGNIDNDLKKSFRKKIDKDNETKSETPKSEGPKSKRQLRLEKVKNKVAVARKKIDSKGAGDTSEDTKIQQSKSKRLRKKAQRIQGRMDRKAIRKGKGTKEEKKAAISTSRDEQRNKRKKVNSEPKNDLIGTRRGVK